MSPGHVTAIGIGVFLTINVGALGVLTWIVHPVLVEVIEAEPGAFEMTCAPGLSSDQIKMLPRHPFEMAAPGTSELVLFVEVTASADVRKIMPGVIGPCN